jgi:hypothetical protein
LSIRVRTGSVTSSPSRFRCLDVRNRRQAPPRAPRPASRARAPAASRQTHRKIRVHDHL